MRHYGFLSRKHALVDHFDERVLVSYEDNFGIVLLLDYVLYVVIEYGIADL